jgi:hypothetical protein
MEPILDLMLITKDDRNDIDAVFWLSLVLAALCYLIFLMFRGFGWDADSFVSAAQFVKLVNYKLYGTYDFGTHPKLLSIVVFGIIYQLFHSFVPLTFVSIAINSIMVAVICKWVKDTGGVWLIALIGLIVNYDWSLIVINCDNPAFSVPFIIFGLYTYYHNKNRSYGIALLLISSLFRPGAEIILIAMILIEWKLRNTTPRIWLPLLLVTLICLSHTLFGIYLAYPTKEQFIKLNLLCYPEAEAEIQVYKHSFRALFYYFNSVVHQLTAIPNIIFSIMALTAIPVLVKYKTSILFLVLVPMATLILPLGIFVYGVASINTLPEKHMEYVIVLPPLAAYSTYIYFYTKRLTPQISAILVAIALLSLFIFCGFTGNRLHGNYEIALEGDGKTPWNHLTEVRKIISREIPKDYSYSLLTTGDNLIFSILDAGLSAYHIDLAEDSSKYISPQIDYDVIIIPQEHLAYFDNDKLKRYRFFQTIYNGCNYLILIKNLG